jgi:transcriptional regulator with XRE-family HTH domain
MDRGSLGERVRSVRKTRDISQEALAREAGVSLNLVNKLERGVVTDPHYSTLSGIARALGVSVQSLVQEPAFAGKTEAPQETGHHWGPKPLSASDSPETGPPQVSQERLEEHFEGVRQKEVDYLNWMIADFWRLALPDEKPLARFVDEDIDTDRVWRFLEHAFAARNVFEPEAAERIKRGAVRKAALVR